jgi:aspartate racemase
MKHVGIVAHSVEGASLSMSAWEVDDLGKIRATLATSIDRLAKAGADFFICPDNTAHRALEFPGEDFALPGLHIIEVVARQAKLEARRKVAVLGTKYLMESDAYHKTFGRFGIDSEVPEKEDRLTINDIIFQELVEGIFAQASRQKCQNIIKKMEDRGCDAVALACTELPLLITDGSSSLPTLKGGPKTLE